MKTTYILGIITIAEVILTDMHMAAGSVGLWAMYGIYKYFKSFTLD